MKIKILKIKIENSNQDFDFADFFEGSNTIFNTNSQLVKEGKDYFWHLLITYEQKYTSFPFTKTEKKKAPIEFEEEILKLIHNFPTKNVRVKNALKSYIDELYYFSSPNEFNNIRRLGKKSITENPEIFDEVWKTIEKHQKKLKS